MTEKAYSKDHLLDFLKQSALAGQMNPATARSRRSAVEYLLAHLPTAQTEDLRSLDVDQLCAKLHKLEGSTIRPEALELYGSRLKAALGDFFSWMENPTESATGSDGQDNRVQLNRSSASTERSEEQIALEGIKLETADYQSDLLSIPIRPDCQVHIANLPQDMTEQEATRIARIIEAMANGQGDS